MITNIADKGMTFMATSRSYRALGNAARKEDDGEALISEAESSRSDLALPRPVWPRSFSPSIPHTQQMAHVTMHCVCSLGTAMLRSNVPLQIKLLILLATVLLWSDERLAGVNYYDKEISRNFLPKHFEHR